MKLLGLYKTGVDAFIVKKYSVIQEYRSQKSEMSWCDDLKFLKIGRQLTFFKLEDYLPFFKLEDELPFLKLEDDLLFFKLEDDLKFLTWKTTSYF